MANGRNNKKNNGNSNVNNNDNIHGNVTSSEEAAELSAEDYEIIAAALATLGDFFAFLALVKAKQVTKETGGEVGPELFIQFRKNSPRRKRR
ncbi:hypothetical protein [Paenibacillus sp.]|uniref:hypothetical protein n=1 Tax=Paenibacillus sp. TaxID=58172 RepID=UPI0028AE8952|nr:hypothetical protein [Paenibacillus sp.]